MLIIQNSNQEILLLKRPSKGIWGGLWGFPEVSGSGSNQREVVFDINETTLKLKLMGTLQKITHQFTHFTLEIFPMILHLKNHATLKKLDTTEWIWYNLSAELPGGVAAPVKKILDVL